MTISKEKTARIRELNDAFRKTFEGGKVMMTPGIGDLPSDVQAMVIRSVATFSDFPPGDDPYQEHDFGSFDFSGHKIFWKIDLYEEPSVKSKNREPVVTRVLTIMLAEEY